MQDDQPVSGGSVASVDADPEVFTPRGTDLVVSDPGDETAVLVTLDKHDEALIVEELQGRLSKSMLYDFPQGGSKLVDLSYVGVRECIHEMNRTGKCRIRVVPNTLTVESEVEDLGFGPEPVFVVTVYAEDDVTGYGAYATAVEPKLMKLSDQRAISKAKNAGKKLDDENRVADPFARQKAVGKAQRNAWKLFIPETLRQTLIAQYRGDATALKTIQAGPGAEQMAELPPPLPADDERANELRARAREVYTEIRAKNPLFILPAQFNSMMTRAEHSYDRLEDLIAALEQKLGEVPEP